jgi:hypothetical protein
MRRMGYAVGVVFLCAPGACSSDGEDQGGSGAAGVNGVGGDLDASMGGTSAAGGSGGTSGSGGGAAGLAGAAGAAGAAGTTGQCLAGGGDCYLCGQLPGQVDSRNCAIAPPELCGYAIPGSDSGVQPTQSAAKFFAMVDCICSTCADECDYLCVIDGKMNQALCNTCLSANCGAVIKACDEDDGT